MRTKITKNPNGMSSRRQFLSIIAAISATAGFGLSGRAVAVEKDFPAAAVWPLWLVEKAGSTVYLMGETPARANAWSDARVEALVKTCAEVWTETNQIRHKNPKELVAKYGLDTSKPITERLSANDVDRLKQVAELAKFPMEALAPMKPWLAAFTIESAYFGSLKLNEEGTAERVLLRSAKALNIPHASEFRSQDDLIEFMGGMTPQEDSQFLQYTLDHILAGHAENERIYAAWARGDSGPADAFVSNVKRVQPDLYAKHMVARNRSWLPRFAAMQKQSKPSLVIVGLYHMAGPDSLLEQLRADGWHVRAA
ncbi:TraB/GumN family protein [Undibacterium sp. Ji22W]|uniref:TraB/GumN family protein n=1 Tax=Undibacterium sp. Ji22W TaxID=3413038 RepID=UPI003BF2CF38